MIAQYTQAAIVSELKRLATPASVDSIPSSAMQEDHVSMGWSAARKLRRALDGLGRVLAVELYTAARALDLRAPLTPGPATAAVRDGLRETVAGPGTDRWLAPRSRRPSSTSPPAAPWPPRSRSRDRSSDRTVVRTPPPGPEQAREAVAVAAPARPATRPAEPPSRRVGERGNTGAQERRSAGSPTGKPEAPG